MNRVKGEGRTRFGRFAAVAIPATVASAGLGVAIVQGMVSATLASADAFTLTSSQITSDSLVVAGGAVDDNATIYAQTGGGTKANGVNITADAALPSVVSSVINKSTAELTISSTDSSVALPNVVLNAKTLAVTDPDAKAGGTNTDGTVGNAATNAAAGMSDVQLGITSQSAGVADGTGTAPGNGAYDPNAFALKAGQSVLNNVSAQAYAITLSGLALDNLSLGVAFK